MKQITKDTQKCLCFSPQAFHKIYIATAVLFPLFLCSMFLSMVLNSLQKCSVIWCKLKHDCTFYCVFFFNCILFSLFFQEFTKHQICSVCKDHCFIVSCEVGLIGWWKGFFFSVAWSDIEVPFPVAFCP
jgi:hypothetical protein